MPMLRLEIQVFQCGKGHPLSVIYWSRDGQWPVRHHPLENTAAIVTDFNQLPANSQDSY